MRGLIAILFLATVLFACCEAQFGSGRGRYQHGGRGGGNFRNRGYGIRGNYWNRGGNYRNFRRSYHRGGRGNYGGGFNNYGGGNGGFNNYGGGNGGFNNYGGVGGFDANAGNFPSQGQVDQGGDVQSIIPNLINTVNTILGTFVGQQGQQ